MRESVGREYPDRDGLVAVVKVLGLRRLRDGQTSPLRDATFVIAVVKGSMDALIMRADRKSQARHCLGFCTADFRSSLVYESAVKKQTLPNLRLFTTSVNNPCWHLRCSFSVYGGPTFKARTRTFI